MTSRIVVTKDLAELLDDAAVYRRTRAGVAALVSTPNGLNRLERGFLGCVTGYTPLRALIDLGYYELGIAGAITRLVGSRAGRARLRASEATVGVQQGALPRSG